MLLIKNSVLYFIHDPKNGSYQSQADERFFAGSVRKKSLICISPDQIFCEILAAQAFQEISGSGFQSVGMADPFGWEERRISIEKLRILMRVSGVRSLGKHRSRTIGFYGNNPGICVVSTK